MMSGFNPKWIIGKIVAKVEMNPFDDGRGGTAYGPRIYFTDGSMIGFCTQETEIGAYGTSISYVPATGTKKPPSSTS